MNTYTLTGELFADMIRGGATNLRSNAEIVNGLNVFPIPDGDTGDNMAMTCEGGARGAGDSADATLSDTAKKVARGMLLAARGNSGVILSQFFEGIARGLDGAVTADTAMLGEALRRGVTQAYSAVAKPVEGTILTVVREATEAAVTDVRDGAPLEEFMDDFTRALHISLDNTPALLPVLKENGVIDSGGAGFVYIAEGMYRVLCGEMPDEVTATAHDAKAPLDTSSFTADSVLEFGYCTEVLLQLQNSKCEAENFDIAPLTDYLGSIGDSLVAFKTGTVVKIHVHTVNPGDVLNFCRKYGEFLTVKIENMSIQHNESTVENRFYDGGLAQTPREHKAFGVVAVASGDGIKKTFYQFGADEVVDGNQTMNPSTEDFLDAFRKIDADNIIVLPNNSNIILAARQAAEIYTEATVYVVESRSIAEGYAAFTMMDLSSGDADTILADMNMAISGVTTGLVTYAVRDTVLQGHEIHTGDKLGFDGKRLVSVADSDADAATGLLDGIDMTDKEVIIAIFGSDATEADTAQVRGYVKEHFANLELFEIDGGQDIYSVIFAVE